MKKYIFLSLIGLLTTNYSYASVVNQSFSQSISGDSSASISHGFSAIPDVIYIQAYSAIDSTNVTAATGSVVGNAFASASWGIKDGSSGEFAAKTFTLCSNVNSHCYNFDMSADNTNLEMRWTQAGSCCGGVTGYFVMTAEYTEPASGSGGGTTTIIEATNLDGTNFLLALFLFLGTFFFLIFYYRTKTPSL